MKYSIDDLKILFPGDWYEIYNEYCNKEFYSLEIKSASNWMYDVGEVLFEISYSPKNNFETFDGHDWILYNKGADDTLTSDINVVRKYYKKHFGLNNFR